MGSTKAAPIVGRSGAPGRIGVDRAGSVVPPVTDPTVSSTRAATVRSTVSIKGARSSTTWVTGATSSTTWVTGATSSTTWVTGATVLVTSSTGAALTVSAAS